MTTIKAAPLSLDGHGRVNILITDRKIFDELPVRRGFRHSERPQAKALWALNAGQGLLMEHGEYPCNRAHNTIKSKSTCCSLTSAASTIGKRRGFLVSVKHVADGRLAVFFDTAS